MRFAEPQWLWLGAVAMACLLSLLIWSARQRTRALRRFVASARVPELTRSVSVGARRLRYVMLLLGVSFVFLALARPQWGYHEEQHPEQGVDLLFAVDTSKSMLAQDVRPSRLVRAKLAVEELAKKVQGDRLGLVAFAGDAFLQTPLTHDRTAFLEALHALDAGVIPVAGTDLEGALRVAERAFESEPEHAKMLVLLSDGEDLAGSALSAARHAAARGVVVHTIGIGTPQGSWIPVDGGRSHDALLRGPDGQLVRSRLDEDTLRKIADITGGSYRPLGAAGRGLEQLYHDELSKLPGQARSFRTTRVYHERFQLPLAAGLAFLLLEWLLGDRRRRRGVRGSAPAALATLALIGATAPAHASDGAPVEHYNAASTHYRAGRFDDAAREYQRALDTRDLGLQERAYYDRGNALYRIGAHAEKADAKTAITQYEQAIASYDAALALNAKDADAKFNRDFVTQKLAALRAAQARQQPQQDPRRDHERSEQAQKQAAKQGQDQNASNAGQPEPSQAQRGDGHQMPRNGTNPSDRQGDNAQAQPESGGKGQDRPDSEQRARAGGKQTEHPGASEEMQGPSAATRAKGGDREGGDALDQQAARAAGRLTRGQAERLLDALQGELRLHTGFGPNARPERNQAQAGKDW